MATAYKTQASKMAAGTQPKIFERGRIDVFSTFAMSNTSANSGFAVNDTVYFLQLEGNPTIVAGGPTVTRAILDVPALESSTGIVTALGDDSSGSYASNYISGATIGRSSAAGQQDINVHAGYGFQPFSSFFGTYTTPSLGTCNIIMKVTTGASGTATTTGTIGLVFSYTMDS